MAPKLSVSEFVDLCNMTLETAYAGVLVEGEVASFKVNQDKWVFFDLKDEECSVGCFMPLFQLRMPLEDGMKVMVKAVPKLTKWGRFSLTVKQIVPVGEGNLKKSFELLKKKLDNEGLFDPSKKRELPEDLAEIGVISSTQAAGYADFCKILNARWGGIKVQVAHTQVQGMDAADQIISALKYFNEKAEVQVIVIIRGGGSADDLAVFNDEALVREIAGSRIPIITGIGHEIDESLADLAADVVASTPTNAAEILTPVDKRAEALAVRKEVEEIGDRVMEMVEMKRGEIGLAGMSKIGDKIMEMVAIERNKIDILKVSNILISKIDEVISQIQFRQKTLEGLNPDRVLRQGYAIVTGKVEVGSKLQILTHENEMEAEVLKVVKRSG